MSDSLAANTEGIAQPVDDLRQLGDRIGASTRELQARLTDLGDCWGDDSTGRSFLEQYDPSRTQLIDGATSLSNVIGSVADGVSTMSKGFAATEDHAVAAVHGLTAGSGEVDATPRETSTER